MGPLVVVAITFVLLYVLFIRPQQRRVREHQALVASVQPGDDVVLTAGIFGRIVDLGPEEMTLAVAPGVELRVARQAILRRVEGATGAGPVDAEPGDDLDDTGTDIGTHSDDTPGTTGPGT